MKSCNNLCNVRSFECVLNFVRFVISDNNLTIQLRMLRMLAKYAARSCLLLAPWILPTCTLITGGEVAFKCLKLSWRLLQTTVTVEKQRIMIKNIPSWNVDKFYSNIPPVPGQKVSLK